MIGWQFHVWALRSLRRGSANMYVLISLGTNAAYFYSLFSIIYGRVTTHLRPDSIVKFPDHLSDCGVLNFSFDLLEMIRFVLSDM